MITWTEAAAKWQAVKPVVIALGIGLVVGPFISNYAGWQVTSSSARAALHDGMIEQLAQICVQRAHAEVKDTSKLEWDARTALAKKWAILSKVADDGAEVTTSCAQKLES
jgi:hypothetical protein